MLVAWSSTIKSTTSRATLLVDEALEKITSSQPTIPPVLVLALGEKQQQEVREAAKESTFYYYLLLVYIRSESYRSYHHSYVQITQCSIIHHESIAVRKQSRPNPNTFKLSPPLAQEQSREPCSANHFVLFRKQPNKKVGIAVCFRKANRNYSIDRIRTCHRLPPVHGF